MIVITLPCETSVNLFTATVMKALNVMTNWQLCTKISQQMFSVCLWLSHTHRDDLATDQMLDQ